MKKCLLIICVLTLVMSITGCGNEDAKNWGDNSISNVLPNPESKKIDISFDDEKSFYATIKDYSEEDYKAYVEKCQQKGFDIEVESDSTSFDAFNDDGYKLSMIYFGENGLTIDLDAPEDFSEFKWPSSEIAKLLPIPKSSIGKIEWEAAHGFVIYVSDTSLEDYNEYVNKCSEKGFVADYEKGDDYYYADNDNGYHLSLKYEGNNTMFVEIQEPDGNEDKEAEEKEEESEKSDSSKEVIEKDKSEKKSAGGVSPEFKKTMNKYEDFFDEYVEFMKKYAKADSSDLLSMATDYANYMKKYTEMMEAMNEIDEDELSEADALYYAKVNARISKKLLEVAEE